MATHSSVPAWKTPWRSLAGYSQSMGSQRVGYDLATEQHQSIVCIGQSQSPNTSHSPFPLASIHLFATSLFLLLLCK